MTKVMFLYQNIDLDDIAFTPITGPFRGTFDGQGNKIQNLTINGSGTRTALFEELGGTGSAIRNLGLENINVMSTNTSGSGLAPSDSVSVGSLVAFTNIGRIENCYAIDNDDDVDIQASTGEYDSVGGLVGQQGDSGGPIVSSYARVSVDGGDGDDDSVGGLVGSQFPSGVIISSYSGGSVSGGEGNDNVGGLVGYQDAGSIISSYSTAAVNGGDGNDQVGGLVGQQQRLATSITNITASYATGALDGGEGDDDVGGLIGWHRGVIIASYATGSVTGGVGNDELGSLLGTDTNSTCTPLIDCPFLTESYGFGTVTDLDVMSGETLSTGGAPPMGVTSVNDLSDMNAGDNWNRTNSPWDFGSSSQAPALRFITSASFTLSSFSLFIDDSVDSYLCDSPPAEAFLPSIPVTCAVTLLPGQPGR